MKRKICVITGTRAEFGLMFWLLKFLKEDKNIELQLIATGMHLSPEFGLTYKTIEESGFDINKKIEVLLSSDTGVGISKSMGLVQISFSEAYQELNPDIIVVLGDRFEIFSAVSAAMICNIPIAHLHGGEATEGLIDESIRHSITKMSQIHFTATEIYRRRVIQLGENPERVFNVGTPGLDNIHYLKLLTFDEFEKSIDFKLKKKTILITFHPVTLENNTAERQFLNLLKALDRLENTSFIFTKPNADTNGRIIIELIDQYVTKNPLKACAFVSLGQLRYLSALKHVDVVLGNSSSGLTEAPSFGIPTINIGDRQNGRIKAESVIDCNPDVLGIAEALEKAFSHEFLINIKDVVNPYGDSGASEKIVEKLKEVDLENILKKSFYDLDFNM
ncbi:UDP-N-acetylglucosamine 2-epimerase [Urechidicola vernalis]|uniref:UDP-N-acetylglucosamine 2-epimerase n=1 Tax=Urechidicola vernalis TaxID=3075600 RepID=A0ABU2Y7H2_9FLAO|nr:UDP-N-acetylglucosamine 2-epimerase [Urechidicola sp. P050]MDT0554148.1 UDP-N-acetylglucosamine 2-epimerase [Urechidicola sp. P050]